LFSSAVHGGTTSSDCRSGILEQGDTHGSPRAALTLSVKPGRPVARRQSTRRARPVRRYQSGIVPKPAPLGLAPKTVRNVHAFLHRALVDAVAWKYLVDSPASNVKPPRRPRSHRQVWSAGPEPAFWRPYRRAASQRRCGRCRTAAMFPISPAESLALRMFPKVFPKQ
jgi:hypothetical protein